MFPTQEGLSPSHLSPDPTLFNTHMDAVLLAELQGLLGLLSEARASIEGDAALLRCVNANLASILRKLQTRAQHTSDAATRPASTPAALRAPLQLPQEFLDLQETFASLQGPLHPTAAAPAGPSVTSTAAAAFLHSLDAVYGQSQAPPPVGGSSLGVAQFAEQAHFVGLVAAALSAVQALKTEGRTSSTAASSLSTAQLKQAVPALLQQCDEWLQAHSSPARHEFNEAVQQQAMQAEVVRWRNRALRSIAATAAAQAAAAGQPTAPSAAAAAAAAAPKPPDVWLPQHCWDPLSAEAGSHPAWQLLLPHPAGTQHRSQQAAGRAQLGSSTDTARTSGAAVAAPGLTYSEVSEVVQYSRQAQKIQQLLLQLAVESQPAPRLLHMLLQCCQQLQQHTAAGSGPAGSASVSHDCCCALYRLVCALAAGPVKERGLGAGCQLAVEAEVPDDSGW